MDENDIQTIAPLSSARAGGCSCGGSCGGSCPTCMAETVETTPVPVYALGRIRPHIPNLGLEKEITQTIGRVFANGPSDEEALCEVLAMDEHRRLAAEICWTFSVNEIDVYALKPADAFGLSMILRALHPDKGEANVDVVIGRLSGRTSFTECNGKMLAAVHPVQIYSLDRAGLLQKLTESSKLDKAAMRSAVKQTLDVTGQLSANVGLSPGHRAINYAVTRSAELYQTVAANLADNWALNALSARPSALSIGRTVVEVILAFRNRTTGVNRKSFMRVDVTDVYPFMVSDIQDYVELS